MEKEMRQTGLLFSSGRNPKTPFNLHGVIRILTIFRRAVLKGGHGILYEKYFATRVAPIKCASKGKQSYEGNVTFKNHKEQKTPSLICILRYF